MHPKKKDKAEEHINDPSKVGMVISVDIKGVLLLKGGGKVYCGLSSSPSKT